MGSWTVDTALSPIIVHDVDGALSDGQFDVSVREATAVFRRCGKHVAIFDISTMASPTAYARARSIVWLKDNRKQLAETCLGVAYVIASPLLRFIAMTVFLVIPLPTPYIVVHSRADALEWARQRAGLDKGLSH